MTTKPPSALAASDAPGPEEATDGIEGTQANEPTVDNPVEDPQNDAVLAAAESPVDSPFILPVLEAPESAAPPLAGLLAADMETPPPVTAAQDGEATPPPIAAAAPGKTPPPVLPGLTPPPVMTPLPLLTPPPVNTREEVTQNARPSLLDEPTEEETKVEPLETARRAAATRGEGELALTEQASAEREKALRGWAPPTHRLPERPLGPGDFEFEDPDDNADDDDSAPISASETPGAIAIDEEDVVTTQPVTSPGTRPDDLAPLSAGGPRLPPPGLPLGRPEGLGGLRLPPASPPFGMPAASSVGAYGLPTPAPAFGPPPGTPGLAPAIGRSPTPSLGSDVPRTRTPAAQSSAFGGLRASGPAFPIPAPSGAPALTTGSSVFSKVQLPVGGLVAFLVAAFSGGLVLGAILWRGGAAEAPVAAAPEPAPVAAPQGNPPPAPPAATAPTPATPPPVVAQPVQPPPAATAPAPAAIAPAVVPVAEAPTSPPAPKPVAARPVRRIASATPVKATHPPRKAGTPTATKGVAKGWVDPFAQ